MNEDYNYLIEKGMSEAEINRKLSSGMSLDEIKRDVMWKSALGLKSTWREPLPASDESKPTAVKPLPVAKTPEAAATPKLDVISAPDLQKANLPPVKYHIEGMLPQGTSLVAAASKIGKSWMVLDMGLCITAGDSFMGHETHKCGVLYLALEDSLSRLQNRMNKVLHGKPPPEQFYFTTCAPTLDNDLLGALDDQFKQHPDIKLVIIDTLQKVRGQPRPREPAYAQDYREMGVVKEYLDKRGISSLFVHHNRKMKDEDDPFNMISGTNGIMGAADTIWVIIKPSRDSDEAVLHITGRDVPQSDTVITFDKNTWTWKPIGAADQLIEQRMKEQYENNPIVKTIRKLLEQSPENRWDGTASELMDAGKYIARTYLAESNQKLGYAIRNLENQLLDYDGIIHTGNSHGTSSKRHHFYYQFVEIEEPKQEKMVDI